MSIMDTISQSWQRIDTWLLAFAPAYAAYLFPGVTAEALEEAEAKLGLTLPADFKASYRIHNGAQGSTSLLKGGT
jgi:cell wall assembly regulator SMI1